MTRPCRCSSCGAGETPLLGRVRSEATRANALEHAADPHDYWGSRGPGFKPRRPDAGHRHDPGSWLGLGDQDDLFRTCVSLLEQRSRRERVPADMPRGPLGRGAGLYGLDVGVVVEEIPGVVLPLILASRSYLAGP